MNTSEKMITCWELWEDNDDHGTLGMFLKKKTETTRFWQISSFEFHRTSGVKANLAISIKADSRGT